METYLGRSECKPAGLTFLVLQLTDLDLSILIVKASGRTLTLLVVVCKQ